MMKGGYYSVIKNLDFEVLEEINFLNREDEIRILNKLKLIRKNNINLNFLNQDLVDLIREIHFDEIYLNKFRKINWEDFRNLFYKKDKSKKERLVYGEFLYFIKVELNIVKQKVSLNSVLLTDKNEQKEKGSDEKILEKKLDLRIFNKKKLFDENLDSKEKAKARGVEILFDYIDKPSKISVNDFVLYFNRRLDYFKELLKNRLDSSTLTTINRLADLSDTNEEVSVIGLINEFSKTKNGHIILTIEDKSGTMKCFINKEKTELMRIVENLCYDEGIAVLGKMGKDIIWVDEIIIPNPPNKMELKKIEKDEYVMFLSDIHFGAKVFVDNAFRTMLRWLEGKLNDENLNNIAKKIKYIIIAGDIIEGIGIYPNQGKDARILSTELQYHEAARWLSLIPKDKTIICIPGNHDTNRLSEPQPKLPYEKAYALYNMENVIMLSNPALISLYNDDPMGGLTFMIYHGGSLFYYADKIKHLREKGGAKVPEEVVKFLLEKRHLAPSHGSTLYIPDNHKDPLVISKMPDFFITGHTHKLSLANYKGCTIVSCGCWVEMSDYQEKMGMFPDVGKCTIINTRTRKPKILNFYTEKYRR